MNATRGKVPDHWRTHGWVCFDNLLPAEVVSALPGWVEALSRPPAGPGERRLHFFEETHAGPAMCRTERYLDDHAGIRALVTAGAVSEMAHILLGEPALVYKEKVNYKAPGGAGFAAHQDATAYQFIDHHVTCLVAVDSMTPENGCLEFARGRFDILLPGTQDGCLTATTAQSLTWDPVPLPRGGVLFFDSLVPHRSAPNRSLHPRRALYLTLNALSDGDRRSDYYATLERSLDQPRGAKARISTIGHFQGRAATPDTGA